MKGRGIRYSAAELRFVEARRAMHREDLHAAFVKKFKRRGVTLDRIKGLCTRRGWTRVPRWTAKEDERLRKLYPNHKTRVVATRLGFDIHRVFNRAHRLGLTKSEAFNARLAAEEARRLRTHGAAHRFTKGQVPPNKGKKMPPGWSPGRMASTQFKKGQATKWSPIGTEKEHVSPVNPNRPKENRYWYRKISDHRNVPWTKNWKALHIIKWEELHGRMPPAHALKCLDGDSLNTEPANWQLISRAELLQLNRLYGSRYDTAPAAVKPAMLTMAKLRLAQAAAKKKGQEHAA